MGLTRDQLRRRLSDVDFRIVDAMQGDCPSMSATAHRSSADARRGLNAIREQSEAGDAWFYRVTYHIRTLIGAGVYSDPESQPIIVLVDLNKGGNYPFSPPLPYMIGPTTPWSPHFLPGAPVCFQVGGHVWRSDGKTTLGHLLLHIARLINFDETIDDLSYEGWNGPAIRFWRRELNAKPITPQLRYPSLPNWYYEPAAAPSVTGTAPKARVAPATRRATLVAGPPTPTPRARLVGPGPDTGPKGS